MTQNNPNLRSSRMSTPCSAGSDHRCACPSCAACGPNTSGPDVRMRCPLPMVALVCQVSVYIPRRNIAPPLSQAFSTAAHTCLWQLRNARSHERHLAKTSCFAALRLPAVFSQQCTRCTAVHSWHSTPHEVCARRRGPLSRGPRGRCVAPLTRPGKKRRPVAAATAHVYGWPRRAAARVRRSPPNGSARRQRQHDPL